MTDEDRRNLRRGILHGLPLALALWFLIGKAFGL